METDIQEKLRELEQQILDAYAKHTAIEQICRTMQVDPTIRVGEFRQIANNILIERSRITEPNNYLMLGEIGASVAREEIRYLVRSLTEKCPKHEVDSITLDEISNSARVLAEQGFTPNHLLLPIDYSHLILKWNQDKKRRDWTRGGIFDTFYTDEGIFIKVTKSNKYVPFSDAILTSFDTNIWEYRPTETSSRLSVKFDWNYQNSADALLSIKTIFNHNVLDPCGNIVITLNAKQ